MKKTILLFDSGSTKTTFLQMIEGEVVEHALPGYNPNRQDTDFLVAVDKLPCTIFKEAQVYFYGSGLSSQESQLKIKTLFENKGVAKIETQTDVLGAARACFGNKSGLFAIMGTGACVGYYNGKEIITRAGGYGYLIDDLGGGLELGKLILSAWLNDTLDEHQDEAIASFLGTKKENFITHFYNQQELSVLSGIVQLIPSIKNTKINHILQDYFQLFLKRHVLHLAKKYDVSRISLVGSIGTCFKEEIAQVALPYNIAVDQTIQYPAENLLMYHIDNLPLQ